jgi:hypothetical protein
MKLAAILGLYFFTLSSFAAGLSASTVDDSGAAQAQGASSSQSQSQSPPSQPAQSAPANAQTTTTATPTKPVVKKRAVPKKAIYPDCSPAPAPLNPVLANPNYEKRNADGAQTGASQADNTAGETTSNAAGNSNPGSPAKDKTAPLKPCPPPKKVVRNGGSDDPKIELLGGTLAQQASNERSTEQITAATEENLKKLAGRQLTASEQESEIQIRQFMQQSKAAVASGDPDRGRNLALKAKLLSDELVKP